MKNAEDVERIERAERLKTARKQFGKFSSAQKVHERFGWPLEAYKAHESGRNGFSRAAGNMYADAFGVSRKWLNLNIGRPEDTNEVDQALSVPVFADVPAGKMMASDAVTSERDLRGHIVISGLDPKGDWAALVVNGHSMNKIAPDGSTIIFNRIDTHPIDNGFFVFKHPETGDATFKRYGAGHPPRLRPYSYDDFDPIILDNDDQVEIVGRVKKVVVDL